MTYNTSLNPIRDVGYGLEQSIEMVMERSVLEEGECLLIGWHGNSIAVLFQRVNVCYIGVTSNRVSTRDTYSWEHKKTTSQIAHGKEDVMIRAEKETERRN